MSNVSSNGESGLVGRVRADLADLLAVDVLGESSHRRFDIDAEVPGQASEVPLVDDDAVVAAAVGGAFGAVVQKRFRAVAVAFHMIESW